MTITKDEAIKTLTEALTLVTRGRDFDRLLPSTRQIVTDALAATSHIAPDAAAIQAEPIARLMHWNGPKHYPIPHGGIFARTFEEFSKGAGEGDGYWKEGEPLYTRAQASPAIAPEASELPQKPMCAASYSGGRFYSTEQMDDYARAAIAMHRASAAKPDDLDNLINGMSAEDRAEYEEARAELMAMHLEEVANMVRGTFVNLAAAEPVPTSAIDGAEGPSIIDIGHGETLRRETKTTGAVGWLRYSGGVLIHSLNGAETRLVESALRATKPAASGAVGVQVQSSAWDDPRFKKLTYDLFVAGLNIKSSGGQEEKALSDYVDARVLAALAAPAAPTDAGVRDKLDAERWRFMMAVADNPNGPEANAMEQFANESNDDDTRPESVQMVEVADKAILTLRSPQAPKTEGSSDADQA